MGQTLYGKVTFSIDLRDIDENKVSALEQEIMQQLQQIAERRHVSLASKVLQRIKPAKPMPYYNSNLLQVLKSKVYVLILS